MPAILRNFRYQTDASLTVIGSCLPYGQGASRLGTSAVCNTYAVRTLIVYAEQPIDRDARCGRHDDVESYVVDGFHFFFGVRYLFRMYCATPSRQKIAVQNRKCVSI